MTQRDQNNSKIIPTFQNKYEVKENKGSNKTDKPAASDNKLKDNDCSKLPLQSDLDYIDKNREANASNDSQIDINEIIKAIKLLSDVRIYY